MGVLAMQHIQHNANCPFTHVWVWHSYNMMTLAGYSGDDKVAEVNFISITKPYLGVVPVPLSGGLVCDLSSRS